MIDRRRLLAGLLCMPVLGAATRASAGQHASAELHVRTISGADRYVALIGIGTARRYQDASTDEQLGALRASIARFAGLGGAVIDTAPSYGNAEEIVGRLVEELGIRDRLFLATKVGANDAAEGRAQIARSFAHLRTRVIDLIAVHNLRDSANQLAILRELKAAGSVRSIGVTTWTDDQYAELEAIMRRDRPDVVQLDYALDNRNAAERLLPLAQELGIAVMANSPFGRGRLFEATRDRALPGWAVEIGVASWAQLFLKYVVSHPARPIAIPGMAQVRYVDDNMAAARGSLPDAAMRRRMEALAEAF